MTPVAVFGYNRPRHLEKCLESINNAQKQLKKPLPLFIFCDAPSKPEHKSAVDATYAVAESWTKKYGGEVIKRETNLALRNITEGVTTLCAEFGSCIVVEDDLYVAPDFLWFISEALKKYADNPRVFMVSGFMYFTSLRKKSAPFFLPTSFIWGWGTWQRAWEHFTWEPKGCDVLLSNKKLRKRFDLYGSMPFSKLLRETLKGKAHSWAVLWMWQLFQREALALYPPRSLVWNMGVGGGLHGKKQSFDPSSDREYYVHGTEEQRDFMKNRLTLSPPLELPFPKEVITDSKALQTIAAAFFYHRLQTERRKKIRLGLKAAYFRCRSGITR